MGPVTDPVYLLGPRSCYQQQYRSVHQNTVQLYLFNRHMPRVVIHDTDMHIITTKLQPLCNSHYIYVIALIINIALIKFRFCRVTLKDSDTVLKLRETISELDCFFFGIFVCLLCFFFQEQSFKH